MDSFKLEQAPETTEYLECQYQKCKEGFPVGQVCIIKNDELWFHLDCTFIFKENLGSALTHIPGFQALSEDKHVAVVASFKGRQQQQQPGKTNIARIALSPHDAVWACASCNHNFNTSCSPNIYTILIKEECKAGCSYHNTHWADTTPTWAMLPCTDPTCHKNTTQLLSAATMMDSTITTTPWTLAEWKDRNHHKCGVSRHGKNCGL
jgi:hypothetical protein